MKINLAKIIRPPLVAALMLIASAADAGTQQGKVNELWVHPNTANLMLSGPTGSRAPCAVDTYWTFDPSTPAGERLLAVLLTAQATQAVITVMGADSCQEAFPREFIQYVRITPE